MCSLQPDRQPCGTCTWMYDTMMITLRGVKDRGQMDDRSQEWTELAGRSHEYTYLGRDCCWSQAVLTLFS